MAEFPALRLWTDAYISDTQHLSNEEHGVYLRLLMFAWRTPSCGLPDDDKRLARMVGMTAKKWGLIKPSVMAFWKLESGEWTQKRLTKEREFVQRNREQKRSAGEASSRAKALNNNDTGSTAVEIPLGVPLQRLVNNPETINHKPETNKKDTSPSLRSGDTRAQGLQFSEFWELYPNKVGRKAAETAFSKAIRRVEFSDLMSGLLRYVRKTDDRQWCNPSTWLNQDRWGDAPALVQERTKGETDYAKRQRSFTEALESTVYGAKNDREFASSNSDIDFGPGDYRSY